VKRGPQNSSSARLRARLERPGLDDDPSSGDGAELPPFRPPYELSGSAVVVVGTWDGEIPATLPAGYRPVRLLGRPAGTVVACHYERPPKELPVRYHEVIAACIARRGLDAVSVPFDMTLDAELPVELGRTHYGLPKRFDAGLRLDIERARVSARAGSGLDVRAEAHGALASACAIPVRLAFSLGVRAITSALDVLGAARAPAIRARIALRPAGLGTSARVEVCRVGGATLRAAWCQAWSWTTTWLGPPRDAAAERATTRDASEGGEGGEDGEDGEGGESTRGGR
jgi:hypothetical protein